MDLEITNKYIMQSTIYYVLLLTTIFLISCKKEINKNNTQEEKSLILKKIDRIDITYIDSRTVEIYNNNCYENDTVFYHDTNQINLYVKGKKFNLEYNTKTNDSIIKLYNLKKFEFEWKKKYRDHTEYEDCTLNRKVKIDSAAVHTLQDRNGAIYQIIDKSYKPMLIQVCYKGKTYKEQILSTIDRYGKLLGNGFSDVMFYDINKDGENELIIIINNLGQDIKYADVYKINLPK